MPMIISLVNIQLYILLREAIMADQFLHKVVQSLSPMSHEVRVQITEELLAWQLEICIRECFFQLFRV